MPETQESTGALIPAPVPREYEMAGKLATKLRDAQKAVRFVRTDANRHAPSVNPQTAIAELSPYLYEQGLIYEFDLDYVTETPYTMEKSTNKGDRYTEQWWRSLVVVRFHLTDVDTGYSVVRRIAGASVNKDGDGVVHAESQAVKQWLLKTLQVAVGNETGGGDVTPPRRSRRQERSAGVLGEHGYEQAGGGWVCRSTGESGSPCAKCGGPFFEGKCRNTPACTVVPRPRPTAQPVTKEEKNDTRMAELKSEYVRLLGRVEEWQEEALVVGSSEWPGDLSEWKEEHYQRVIQLFRTKGAPVVMSAASQAMGRKQPAPKDVIDNLRSRAAGVGPAMQARAEVAIASNWIVAVETMLEAVAHEELTRSNA